MLTLNRPRIEQATGDLSDIALVERALGDARAFEPLFDRYWEPIFRFCLLRLSDWQLAEDSASQAFINAHAHLRAFHGVDDSAFRCWLFAIARNTVRDTQRSVYRHPASSLSQAMDVADPERSLEERALDAERHWQLQQILNSLPDEHRQLIELRAAGLTAAEIGTILGKSEGAVRQAQSRLIRGLRTQFAESAESESDHG